MALAISCIFGTPEPTVMCLLVITLSHLHTHTHSETDIRTHTHTHTERERERIWHQQLSMTTAQSATQSITLTHRQSVTAIRTRSVRNKSVVPSCPAQDYRLCASEEQGPHQQVVCTLWKSSFHTHTPSRMCFHTECTLKMGVGTEGFSLHCV